MMRPAIRAVARAEWSRQRRLLVALGIAGGLLGGVIVAGAELTERTATAPQRLAAATSVGDVHMQIFGDRSVADDVAALPGVAGTWLGGLAVARVGGVSSLFYVGVVAEIEASKGMVQPVVLAGRMPSDGAASDVALNENLAGALDVDAGDTISLDMLTGEEVSQFDTGFGAPDGPHLELRVSAVVRLPPGVLEGGPIIATPAFARQWPGVFAGFDMFVDVDGDAAAQAQFDHAIATLGDELASVAPAGADFSPLSIDDPLAGTRNLQRSSRVLIGGLVAAVLAAAAAVMAAFGQAWSRHHRASSADQRIEAALGMTAGERTAARAAVALVTAVIAAGLAAAIGAAGGWLRPAGALDRVEPSRGYRVRPYVLAAGAGSVLIVMLLIATVTAWRAGRGASAQARVRRRRAWMPVPRRAGWLFAGVSFALRSPAPAARASGRSPRMVPVRTTLLSGAVGVAGLAGAMTFGASLDRLADTPARYGWNGDFAVFDVNDGDIAELASDDRFEAVADLVGATVRVDGRSVDAQAFTDVLGHVGWELLDGRVPNSAGEIVLGSRLADREHLAIGDDVSVGASLATVVGIGIGPPLGREELGSSVLLHPDGLAVASPVGAFREALVAVRPGVDVESVLADLGTRYELEAESQPQEVRNVTDLGSLPELLGGFLALIAAAALMHALVLTSRHRAGDLAVLRALGATPAQAGLVIVAMALTTAAVAVVIGVPLGWSLARLIWGQVAAAIGVRGDVVMPAYTLLAAAGAVVVAVVLAAIPARHAMRASMATALRSE